MSFYKITYSTMDGYSISHYNQIIESQTTLNFTRKFLGLYFNLGNEMHYAISNHTSGIFLKNHYNIINLPPLTPCELIVQQKGRCTFICIQFTPVYLSMCDEEYPMLIDFLRKEKRQIPALLSNIHLPISSEMHDIILNILRNRHRGVKLETYLAAKVLDLLMLCLKHIRSVNNQHQITRPRLNAKKIQAAHDYLVLNIGAPYSISMMASKFNINKRKLTTGFKTLFGKTIHDFIIDERMRQARVMLRDTTKQIKEIAEFFGYKNSSNFTEVFKKKFGHPPQSLRQHIPKKKELQSTRPDR